jgi:hypothetical protein
MSSEEEKATSDIIRRNFDLNEIPAGTDSFEKVREHLIDKLNSLLDHDFEKLLWILYRIDVSEEKAKSSLAEKSDRNPAEILADLIIERQIEKAKTRLKYRSDPPTE